jgi:Heterokaryon incompatibility protein (HET)
LATSLSEKEFGSEVQRQQTFLPTRVLDLGILGQCSTPRGLQSRLRFWADPYTAPIRLVSPAAGSVGQYLTLSHGWGENQHFKLTSVNSESFHQKIPFESLPKTFQDAVIVTRKLGYQYLWIDALCIVQDDLGEWQREAARMANVYHNSTCTIAGHSAKNDSEGFLAAALEPIPYFWLPPRPQAANANSSGSNSMTPRSLFLGGSFKGQVNESFLARRGWVFQERILSRRILHFTRHHIFFEDGSRVQSVDIGHSHRPWTHSSWKDDKLMVQDVVASLADWYKIIERYSLCALTFERDRLPAISGIARLVETYDFAGDYLFGLWSKSLHQGLLWVAVDPSPQRVSYESNTAPPSWSWANWKGRILFPSHIAACKPLFELIDSSQRNGSFPQIVLNPTEQRRAIFIRAQVMELRNVGASLINRPAGELSFEPAISGLYTLNSEQFNLNFSRNSSKGIFNWVALDGETHDYLLYPTLSCVVVSSFRYKKVMFDAETLEDFGRYWTVWYLILLIETGENSGCYRRVGMGAKFRHPPEFQDVVTKTIQIE